MYLSHPSLRCISLLSCLEVLDCDTAVEVTFLSRILKDQELDRDCVRGIFNLSAAPCGGSLGITQEAEFLVSFEIASVTRQLGGMRRCCGVRQQSHMQLQL